MTDGKRILRNSLLGLGAGFLLGLFCAYNVSENFDWGGGVLYGLTAGIDLGLVCLAMTITATKTRSLSAWMRKTFLSAVGIVGAIVFFRIAYVIAVLIVGVTFWRNH